MSLFPSGNVSIKISVLYVPWKDIDSKSCGTTCDHLWGPITQSYLEI